MISKIAELGWKTGLLVFLTSSPLFAQEEDLALSFGDEEFVSIATGQKQLVSKAPAVASVITYEDMKRFGAKTLEGALETVPGLHVAVNNFYLPIYTMRGIYSKFNPQVLVLINGIPISNLFLSSRGTGWGEMPIEAISRIEVIRGPGSAVYGADAFAGTINIITKNEQDLRGTDIGGRIGSFETSGVWITHGSQIKNTDIVFAVEYQQTDGQDEIIDADLQNILDFIDGTSASLAPGPVNLSRDRLDMRLDIHHGHWRVRAGMQKISDLGTAAGVGEALDPSGRWESNSRNLDVTYHQPNLADAWDIQAQLSYYYVTQEVDENIVLFPPGSELGLNGAPFPDGVIGNPEMFENHWRANFSAFYNGFTNHSIRIGTGIHDAELSEVKESKNFGLDGNGDPISPGDPIVSVDDTPFIFLPEDDRQNVHVFVQDIWQFASDWELTTGLRYDDYSDFGDTLNPRLALVWSTSHNLTTKFLYGTAFRAPSFADTRNQNNPVSLGNPDLNPEEIETFEIAFDLKLGYNTRLGLNVFTYEWREIIDFIPDPAPATTATAQNEGKQTGEGLEVELEWEASSTVNVIGNYSYQDSEIKETGATAPNAPQQQFYARVDWTFRTDWSLVSQVNHVMDRERPMGDTRPAIDDYTLVDLTLYYQPDALPWEFRLSVHNLFDEAAFEPSTPVIPNDFPLAKRYGFAEVSYHF